MWRCHGCGWVGVMPIIFPDVAVCPDCENNEGLEEDC